MRNSKMACFGLVLHPMPSSCGLGRFPWSPVLKEVQPPKTSPASVFLPQWRGLELGRQDVAAWKVRCAEGKVGRQPVFWSLQL